MRKKIFFFVIVGCSSPSLASESNIKYEYNKSSNEIYAESGSEKGSMKFEEDNTGNPSYSFDYFSGAPAIITDGRSLHDYTTYATLSYKNQNFYYEFLSI